MAVLALSFESGDDSLSVRRFVVHEAMSALFDVSIVARSPNEDIDLDAIVGRPAGFLAVGQLLAPRAWTGIVTEMEQIAVEAPTARSLGLSTYFIRIVPTLWLATQRSSHRVFQHLSVPAIVQKILGEYGIEPKLTLKEAHAEQEYRVQHGETDFAFMSRLLEEEGISFHYSQKQGDEGLVSELVLSDKPELAEARGPVPYVDHPNEAAAREYVTDVHVGHAVRPGRVTIRDYDFKKPDYLLLGEAEPAKAPEDFYEHYLYEHGAFTDDKGGARRATVALERERRPKRRVSYNGNVFDLSVGRVFAIDNHPHRDLAVANKLLVIEASYEGTTEGEWTISGEACFASAPYRPALRTPRPRISGLQSAVVVGPKGEEIHTDELGRVRVQFHWDREGQHDEKSSCWVRVSQGWAGAGYGMIALPRIGQEVLVSFWEGNPDQPVVVGRVYNNKNPVPYKLPDHKTKTAWKSRSSPHSDGFNEITMEDRAGRELLFIQAQKDLSKLVKHNEEERTGANRTMIVGANRSSIVGAVDGTLVGAKYSVVMATPKELHIAKMGSPEVEAKKTSIEMSEDKITLTTGKATVEIDGAKITLKADGDIKLSAGGDVVIHGGPFVKINC